MKRVLVAFILTACAVSFAQAQTIQMKLGHYAALTHPGTVASKMFAEGVEQRTQGKIKIVVYPDNELGTPDDVLSKCIRGDVDMALPYHGHLGKYAKKFNCVMLPFVFDSYAQADGFWTARSLPGPLPTWRPSASSSSRTGSGGSAISPTAKERSTPLPTYAA